MSWCCATAACTATGPSAKANSRAACCRRWRQARPWACCSIRIRRRRKACSCPSSAAWHAPRPARPRSPPAPEPRWCRASRSGKKRGSSTCSTSSRRWNWRKAATRRSTSSRTPPASPRWSSAGCGSIRTSGFGCTGAGRRGRPGRRGCIDEILGKAAAWGALAWLMLLAGLGGFGLIGPDEPRYAAIAAAMARTQDWITPRLWGAAWFEKPVLYYWLAGLSQRLRGVSAAAARLPNAVLAIATIAALWWFLRRTHSARAGALAGFLGLTSVFIFGFGRAATTDMTLAAPLTLGLLALYLWLENG